MSFYRRSDGTLPHSDTADSRQEAAPPRDILTELLEEDLARDAAMVARAMPMRQKQCAPVKVPFSVLDPCIACQKRSAVEGSNFCIEHACRETNVDGSRCPNHASDGRTCRDGYHTSNSRIWLLEEARLRREAHSTIEQNRKVIEHLEAINFFTRSFPLVGHPSPASSTSSLPSSSPPSMRHASISPSTASSPGPIAVPFFPIPDLRIVSQPGRRR